MIRANGIELAWKHDRFSKWIVLRVLNFLMCLTVAVFVAIITLITLGYPTADLVDFYRITVLFFGSELILTAWVTTKGTKQKEETKE